MNLIKKSKIKCVYCKTSDANTDDHAPSKNLFHDTSVVSFITVPACKICNAGFSKDEEFFRNFVCNLGLENSTNAQKLFTSKITRSIQRKPRLAESMFQKMQLVDVYTPGGIYLGKRTKISVDSNDHSRIDNIITKYTKAYFFKHFNIPIPDNFDLRIVWPQQNRVLDILKKIKCVGRASDVFSYGYGRVPKSFNSTWLFVFFDKVPFLVFVIDEKFRKKANKKVIN